jgi:SAM-dependent methyltransferase
MEISMRIGDIANKASRILPYGVRSELKKQKQYIYTRYFIKPSDPVGLFTSEWYLAYLARRFGDRIKSQDAGPIAPPELLKTEALMHPDELKGIVATPENYFASGRREAWTVLTTVEKCGADATAIQSVLEFGCGSARVLRHFRYIEGLRLAGTDANPTPIEWDRKNLHGIEFSHNRLQPPLSYKDGSFDLIYAISVFTHIPLVWQQAWLDELNRVLRPGGYLLCTVHGDNFINSQLNDDDRVKLQREGNLTLDARSARASYSTQVLGSWDVFQSRDSIRKAFGKNFELVCFEREAVGGSRGQDALVLRKSISPV